MHLAKPVSMHPAKPCRPPVWHRLLLWVHAAPPPSSCYCSASPPHLHRGGSVAVLTAGTNRRLSAAVGGATPGWGRRCLKRTPSWPVHQWVSVAGRCPSLLARLCRGPRARKGRATLYVFLSDAVVLYLQREITPRSVTTKKSVQSQTRAVVHQISCIRTVPCRTSACKPLPLLVFCTKECSFSDRRRAPRAVRTQRHAYVHASAAEPLTSPQVAELLCTRNAQKVHFRCRLRASVHVNRVHFS